MQIASCVCDPVKIFGSEKHYLLRVYEVDVPCRDVIILNYREAVKLKCLVPAFQRDRIVLPLLL